jgi:TolA-binding protein
MKERVLILFIASFFSLILNADEPSAFGAGDIDSPTPYGLTKEEKLLLQNKDNLQRVTVKSNNQSNELQSLRDRLDGFQSIIENLSRKSHKNNLEIKNINKIREDADSSSKEFQARLLDMSNKNKQEIDKLKTVIVELSALIDSINKNYVSKQEFNSLVNSVNSFKDLVSSELKVPVKESSTKFKSKSNHVIAKLAKTKYDEKFYTEAIQMYSYLIEKNYKPARAHYMIGQMKYYREEYSDAIAYFKKSAKLYSKASYMPKLMYLTAFSMKFVADNKNAKAFFKALIKKYPNSKYVSESKKQLQLIK